MLFKTSFALNACIISMPFSHQSLGSIVAGRFQRQRIQFSVDTVIMSLNFKT